MRLSAVFLLVAGAAAFAGCLSFGELKSGSNCQKASPEVVWLNAPAAANRVEVEHRAYDRALADPAFTTGVVVGGDLRFHLQARGEHLVEVFLMAPEDSRRGFVLEAGGKAIDVRYRARTGPDRLRPKGRLRHFSLLGIAGGGTEFAVRTDAPRYTAVAVRWTPREEFESRLAPVWLDRARRMLADPFFEGLRTARRNYAEQLFDRLALSGKPEVRREAVLGLTRVMYWLTAENHEPRDIDRTAELFRESLALAPGDSILRQMISSACLGINVRVGRMPGGDICEQIKPVAWKVALEPAPAGAPEWAVAQRKLRARMDAITRWWVEKRLQPNGEIGGGWGDDVEILRHWGPQALGLGSEVAARGMKAIANGLWNSGTLLDGYDRQISDVEHSSEPTTDTQPLLAALDPDNPEVLARLKRTAACSENWIGRQPDGRWRFRGAWFNCKQVDGRPERAVDVHLNVRAMGPALWYAYLSRDPELVERLARWAESWVEAMRSTAHGKPRGAFPSVVQAVDGSYLIGSAEWDQPNAEWDYFQWSGGAQEALTSLVLAVHDLTGQPRWLAAVGETFQVLEGCGQHPRICEDIRKEPQAFYEWRRRSGNPRYDAFFGYTGARGAREALARMAAEARESEGRLGLDFGMYTSEVMYTDRVYYPVAPEYRQMLFGGEAPRGERYPTFAVTWPAGEGEFARAVIEATGSVLTLRLYNFEAKAVTARLRAWRLGPGWYRWEARDAKDAPVGGGGFEVRRRAQLLELPLPARTEVTITIRP